MDFLIDTVTDLARAVRDGQLSARDLVSHALDRIDRLNGSINAFVALDADGAMREAGVIDDRQSRGESLGALAGIPIAVKDLEDARGLPTTHGSDALEPIGCAESDSTLVARLRRAGAIVVGKTNTPELGFAPQTYNARFGVTRNPWDTTRSSGGSSGGSAAAIASGMVPLATGSDGGGSLRIPSALCGLSGFKPSLGYLPSGGAAPPDWPLLSTKGVMAWKVRDLAAALDEVVGPDPTDLRSMPAPTERWASVLIASPFRSKVIWSPTLGYAGVDREIGESCRAAVDRLADLGIEVEERDDIWAADPAFDWVTMEAIYLARSLSTVRNTPAWERVTPALRDIVEAFGGGSGLDLLQAEDRCHELNVRLAEVLAGGAVLVCPTLAGHAPVCGGEGTVNGAETIGWISFTYPFNMTRSPAGTVCVGRTATGMPIGLQLVGPQHGDALVLTAMATVEDAIDFQDRPDLSTLTAG